MQTRRLRLGDVVDDYCPRERRLSNHVVVAMVDDAIKQTRCTTCDFEHPYKDGKLPARRKKKDGTAALYEQVLEGMTDKPLLAVAADEPVVAAAPVPAPPSASVASATERPKSANLRSRTRAKAPAAVEAAPASTAAAPPPPKIVAPPARADAPHAAHAHRAAAAAPAPAAPAAAHEDASPAVDVDAPAGENEPLHRRTLIRATLPRPVGEVPVRQAPTFTIREAARAPKFRRPFARNARPQAGQNGVMNGPPGRQGARGPQARGKKGGAGAQHAQHGAHRFGQSHGQGHGHGHGSGSGHQGAHHAKGRQGGQGNKRFK
jgi:translation initiation factor IF-2